MPFFKHRDFRLDTGVREALHDEAAGKAWAAPNDSLMRDNLASLRSCSRTGLCNALKMRRRVIPLCGFKSRQEHYLRDDI